jgi:hypothetical protein
MLPQEVGERFVRQFLKGRRSVARQLLQLVESIVVEGDQLAHALPLLRPDVLRTANGYPEIIIRTSALPNGMSIRAMATLMRATSGTLRYAHLSSR